MHVTGTVLMLTAAALLPAAREIPIQEAEVTAASAFQAAPADAAAPLVETGTVQRGGREILFRIRRLPVESFPQLPEAVAAELKSRRCMIPQTWEAHRPENVVQASLERAGSKDWAVLCAAQGRVSLLVFFSGNARKPMTLATWDEKDRLAEHGGSRTLGFAWGIDPATPSRVREAQAGMEHKPPPLDHDALADSELNGKTVYRYYAKGAWTVVDTGN